MTIITKLAVASMILMTFTSMARTVELDDKALQGAAHVTYYAKRCVKFDSLPLRTQRGIIELNSLYGDVIMAKMIEVEETLGRQFGGASAACSMIRRAYPSLLD